MYCYCCTVTLRYTPYSDSYYHIIKFIRKRSVFQGETNKYSKKFEITYPLNSFMQVQNCTDLTLRNWSYVRSKVTHRL